MPPIFKSRESMYEAISNAAMVKGLKLRLQQLKRRKELQKEQAHMKFMTEIDEGVLPDVDAPEGEPQEVRVSGNECQPIE